MKKLIIKKERNLLLFSHVINDYPFLKIRLEKHTTIDAQILKKEKATEEELNIYRMRNDIVTQAKNEWETIQAEAWIYCQLIKKYDVKYAECPLRTYSTSKIQSIRIP